MAGAGHHQHQQAAGTATWLMVYSCPRAPLARRALVSFNAIAQWIRERQGGFQDLARSRSKVRRICTPASCLQGKSSSPEQLDGPCSSMLVLGKKVASHLGLLLRHNRKGRVSCTFPLYFKNPPLVKGSFNRLLKEICKLKERLLRKLLDRSQAQKQPCSREDGFTA